jgi:hypothetical protein
MNYLDFYILCFIKVFLVYFLLLSQSEILPWLMPHIVPQLYVFFHFMHDFQFNLDTGNDL